MIPPQTQHTGAFSASPLLGRGTRAALGCLAVLAASVLLAQEPADAGRSANARLQAQMAERANAFLSVLDEAGRASASTGYDNAERRTWAFGPVRREGIVLSALSREDFGRLEALLDTALSDEGMDTWRTIRALESELRRRESTPEKTATHRDPNLYWLRVYGVPGSDAAWSWRFEGHHLALHVTCVPGKTPTVTPFFLGASPVFVDDPSTPTDELVPSLEAFVALNQEVRAFVDGLSADESAASMPEVARPADIRMGPGVDVLPEALGLDARSLGLESQGRLARILARYQSYLDPALRTHSLRDGLATDGEIGVHFVRWGSVDIAEERAWAVRAPSFVLEFATTTGPDHVHALLRDSEQDFGGPAR